MLRPRIPGPAHLSGSPMMSCFLTKRDFTAWIAGLLALMLNAQFSIAAEPAELYQPRTLATVDQDVSTLGLKGCPSIQALDDAHYLAVCRMADAKAASSLFLFLIDARQSGEKAILFRSKDFGDAYYVKITVFSKGQGKGPEFILAESGAESSYGIEVYTLDGAQLRRVGAIAEVLDNEGEGGSVLPALQIRDHGPTVVFSFTNPVMVPDRQGNYAEVAPEQVRYILDGPKLRRVTGHPKKPR